MAFGKQQANSQNIILNSSSFGKRLGDRLMIYTNGDLRNKLLPTLEQIRKYIRLATEKDLKYRDVRPLNSFLQKLPQVDRYYMGLMLARKIALLGFDYDIKFPDDVTVPDSESKRLAEVKTRFIKSKMHSTFNTIMNGILFGRSAVRLKWSKSDTYNNMVEKKTNLEITELDFSFDNSDQLDLIRTNLNYNFSRIPLDPDIHLFVRYNPIDGICNDFIGSLAQTNMLYIWLKYTDYFNWSSANEKFADPLRYAQWKKGTNPDEVAKVMAGLAQLGTDSYAGFSDDIQVKFLEALRTGITDMHKEFIAAVNTEMAVSVLGQTLTTDVKDVGSFAAAKVHNYVRQDILWGDIIEFQNILTDQYVHKDWDLNYGEPKIGYPAFRFITDETPDYESNARVISEGKAAGMKFKSDEAYKKIGYTKPETGDEVI